MQSPMQHYSLRKLEPYTEFCAELEPPIVDCREAICASRNWNLSSYSPICASKTLILSSDSFIRSIQSRDAEENMSSIPSVVTLICSRSILAMRRKRGLSSGCNIILFIYKTYKHLIF